MIENLVSVIIPYYNKKDTINRSVDSVINQTYKNWELIIVDDKGIEPLEINPKWKNYNILCIYNEKNVGAAQTRQYGQDIANGEYIAFLDADDWWEILFLENCIYKLKKDKYIDGVYVKTLVHYPNGLLKLRRYSNLNLYKIRETVIQFARPWQTSAIVWRKTSTGDWGNLKTYEDGWFEVNSAIYNKLLPIDYIGNNLDRTKENTLSFSDFTQINQQLLYINIYKNSIMKLNLKYKIILYHRLIRGQYKIIENFPSESKEMGGIIYQLNNNVFIIRNNVYFLKLIHKILQKSPFKIFY